MLKYYLVVLLYNVFHEVISVNYTKFIIYLRFPHCLSAYNIFYFMVLVDYLMKTNNSLLNRTLYWRLMNTSIRNTFYLLLQNL